MRVGLYSITYLGVWYRGPALTLFELVDRAKRFGYDGIEIDGKRPHGNPIDLDKAACGELRRYSADAGIDIYAVAANNDFSSPIPEHRESQLVYMQQLIRMTADLGAKTLRVFGAWAGVTQSENGARYDIAESVWKAAHQHFTGEQTWNLIRSGLIECAAWASDAGVTLALQNHAPVIDSCDTMLRMIRDVGSPNVRACFDAPLARKQGETPETMRTACHRVAKVQALTHFGGEYDDSSGAIQGFVRNRDGSLHPEDFYPAFTQGMLDIGYDGYTGYELCHPLPKVNGETVGIDFVDKNARLAAQYMRGIIASARRNTVELATPSVQ